MTFRNSRHFCAQDVDWYFLVLYNGRRAYFSNQGWGQTKDFVPRESERAVPITIEDLKCIRKRNIHSSVYTLESWLEERDDD